MRGLPNHPRDMAKMYTLSAHNDLMARRQRCAVLREKEEAAREEEAAAAKRREEEMAQMALVAAMLRGRTYPKWVDRLAVVGALAVGVLVELMPGSMAREIAGAPLRHGGDMVVLAMGLWVGVVVSVCVLRGLVRRYEGTEGSEEWEEMVGVDEESDAEGTVVGDEGSETESESETETEGEEVVEVYLVGM
ncbi:hypothetical protein BN946_scf185028.g4 [Trametes cinnabarina]|uniref:Uncharacterized protein n=1 Tax=Pycnoporus cinnabarinus TaxID=5643 RepID=A0A060SW91_PYCCI|nr:hypothetical protein BN946_scf185028.g4 [Trametes cinnabarina]